MSGRVVSVLRQFAPELEVYSIDESFLNFSGLTDPLAVAVRMRRMVGQWTGIPISVGLGPTKTLAKLANRLAKIRQWVYASGGRGRRRSCSRGD